MHQASDSSSKLGNVTDHYCYEGTGTVKNSANLLTATGPALARIVGTVMAREARDTVNSLGLGMGFECNMKTSRTTLCRVELGGG